MATAKTNTAMVYNPSRTLTVKKTVNPVKKTQKRRTNPAAVKKVVNASSHRRRRSTARRNPAGMGLLVAALMAGLGVWGFDVLSNKFLGNSSTLVRVGTKFGGAFLLQSNFGSKLPILGKYKNEIALVLAVSGVVDLLETYVLPTVKNLTGGLLNFGGQTIQMQPVPAGAELAGDVYYTVEDQTGDGYDDGEVWNV